MKSLPIKEIVVACVAVAFSAFFAFVTATIISNSKITDIESKLSVVEGDFKELQAQRASHKKRLGFWREDGIELEKRFDEKINRIEERILDLERKSP